MLITAPEKAGRTRTCVTIFRTRKLRLRDDKAQVSKAVWPRILALNPSLSLSVPCSRCFPNVLRTVVGSRWRVGSGTRGLSRSRGPLPSPHFYNLWKSSHARAHAHTPCPQTLWLTTVTLSDLNSSITSQRQSLAPGLVRLLCHVFCINTSRFSVACTSVYHYKCIYLNDTVISV